MKKEFGKFKLGTAILAVLVIFFMSAGAFIGAAQEIAGDQSGSIEALLPSMDEALPTEENIPVINTPVVELESGMEFIEPIIPDMGPGDQPDIFEEVNFEDIIESDKTIVENTIDSSNDPDKPMGMDGNSFSNALEQITEHSSGSMESTSTEEGSRAPLASLTIVIGTDGDTNDGQGMGYVRRSSTTYYGYDGYYMYNYISGTTYENRGWAVFDLSDLNKYGGMSITSGNIVWRHDSRSQVTLLDFWTMKSIPYDIGTSTTAQSWFDEIGGSGSTKIGSESFTGSSDYTNKDIKTTLNSGGINWLNSQISSANTEVAFGATISKLNSGTYGYIYCYDVRLELTFSYSTLPTSSSEEIAVGDTLNGYVYSTSTNYDIGRIYTSGTTYRGYASWDTLNYKSLIPTQGPTGEKVTITGISLRINSVYGYLNSFGIYHMKTQPKDGTSASTLYTDCADGTKYYSPAYSAYTSSPNEYEWDLGPDALDDFNNTLTSNTTTFFALGFSQSSYNYMYSPKLVIKWKIEYPPMHQLRLGADNPEKAGNAVGYSRVSGSTGYSTSHYYTYLYKYSTSTEYRGWMVFDLSDLNKWEGVSVKSAKIIVQNYRRYEIKDMKFTALKTTPYDSAPSTTAKSVFDESGPSGTVIGSASFSTSSDYNYYQLEFPLSTAAATAINNKLSSSSNTKTFGIGAFIDSFHSGNIGYLYWRDVRLEVSFTFDSELRPSKSGNGLAFGDEISGHIYKSTTPQDRPYGYMYVRYSSSYEYRGYAQWDISDIQRAFDTENISKLTFTKVSLRMNHWKNSLNNIEVYQVKNNITKTVTSDPSTVFTDLGDGAKYYSGGSTGSTFTEYEWDLGSVAVTDFQDAFMDNTPDFFAVGIITTSTTGYMYEHEPQLVLEFKLPEKTLSISLEDETPEGFEGTPIYFNANTTRNVSGGDGGMYYEWDFDGDEVFDLNSTSPYAQYTWDDDYTGTITLKVTDTGASKSLSANFSVTVHNVDPVCNLTNGAISPQPAYEASEVKFSGFSFVDPGNDTWWYFWDFNMDGVYDKGGKCNGKNIPDETWYYDDDFLGEVSLLIVDEDGGTTNISTKHEYSATPISGGTGYVYNYGTKYTSSTIYYRYSYTYDYQRGWAKIDLSSIPEDAIIKKVIFKGTVSYNNSVNYIGVHLLTNDPTSAAGSTVFNEAGTNERLFGLTGSTGDKEKDLTSWASGDGKSNFSEALENGWLGLGFDFESPLGGYYYGYMQGYSYYMPKLDIEYEIQKPGCFIPVVVLNKAPVINCNNMTITPTILKEGEKVSISNISFCDAGNDTYELKFVVGDEFETDWEPLGGRMGAGGSGGTMMDIGSHVTSYSGMTRGYWFQAPTDFTITGVRIPTDASTDAQSIAVLRMNANPSTWVYSSTTNDFVQLGYWKDVSGSNIINANIFVEKDDYITILGCRGSNSYNSYGSALYQTKIGAYDVTLTRAGMQYNLYSTAPQNIWTEINYNIGRIEMYYTVGTGKSWGAYGAGCHNINQTFNVTVPDDHPSSGTSWDNVPISVLIRDDDDHKLIPKTGVGSLLDASTITSSAYYSYALSNTRKIAIDNDYNLYVMYVDRTTSPYQIYVGKSEDNGVTWDQHKVSTGSWLEYNSQYYPSLAIDSDGYLHAVWSNSGSIIYANSKDGGESWGDWHNITTSGYHYSPGISVDANNNIHIAWYGYLTSTPYSIYHIQNFISNSTWSKITQVSESGLYSYYPSLASDSKGNVHIVWQGYTQTSTYYNIRHRMYWAGNDTWSGITDLTSGSYYNYYPSITVDSSDNAHVVWNGADPVVTGSYNIMYNKFSSSSKSWSTKEYITKITTGSPYQYNPSIAVNAKGELDVIWHGYQSPSWSSPYAIHHAQKSGSTWDIDWNVFVGSGYQYYANIFCSPQHNVAKSGYAFTWYDAYYSLKYWSSEDFEYGNPKFTDGLDFCNNTVKVNNVAPKFDLKSIYTTPSEVKEQEPFILHAEFEDPAAGFETENFQYNIQIKGGDSSGWLPVTKFKEGQPAGMTEIEYQPDAAEGKDAFTYAYSSYQDYNYGAYTYVYMGKTSTATNYKRRGFLSWDLGWIPSGYNVTKATMYLTFSYYYNSGPSATGARWFTANESWIEGTKTGSTASAGELTWNNMPGYDTSREVSMMTWPSGSSASGKTEWELNTTIVQEWIDNPNSNFGMVSQLDNEDLTSYYGYGYFYSSDYTTASMRPQLVLEFDSPLPAILPRGIIEVEYLISDDHPETGTPWDLLDFSVELRDDDLGSDKLESNITVNNVPPEIIEGTVLPDVLIDMPDLGIPEGTMVSLEGFEFDDIAYDVWSEREYGFNYSVDWGDGEVTSWNNDFSYTGDVGGSSGSASEENIAPLATPTSSGGGSGTYGPISMNDLNTANMCWVSSSGSPNSNYFQLTWDKKYTIAKMYVIIHGSWSNSGNRHLDACDVQYRVGSTWITDSRLTSISGDFEYEFKAPRTTDGVRLYDLVTTGSQASNPCVYEWYVYPGGSGGIINENVNCSSSAYNNGRKLVMDSTDNMYTVFVDKTSPNQISISNSSDFGETWTLNAVTSGTTAQLDPSIVIDSKDVLHVVWRGMVSGYYNIRYANSADGGETWSNSKDITTGTSSPTEHLAPAIAVDSDDTVHIVWYGHDTTNTAKYNIYYISRNSIGTWGTTTMLTSDTSDMYHQYPTIAVDSNDDVHVVWSGQTSSAAVNNIQYKMYDISLSTWSSIKMLTTSSSNNNYNPSMAIDRDDNIHIVWHAEPSPTTIKYIKYDAVTSTWYSIEDVTSNSVNNMNPSVGVDHRGYVYVAWSKTEPNQINMSMNDGRYWTAEFELTSPSVFNSTVVYPSIIYGSKHSLAGRGVSLVFTAANMTACNLYYGVTTDYNQTDFGPWKGIPTLKHLYRDDSTSNTEFDVYNLTIQVRDDDMGIGEWVLPVKVYNVWPTLDKSGLDLALVGNESGLYTPEIPFTDPGTGATETWSYWLDVDNSETLTSDDLTGPITTTSEVNGKTQGIIQPILTPFNDDYSGTIDLYIYDDDILSAQKYINFSIPVQDGGKVVEIKDDSMSSATAYNNGRNLVMDSNDNLYSIYSSYPSPYQIFVSVSNDLGQYWTEYKVSTDSASSGQYQYYPSIAIDSNDVLHAVWQAYVPVPSPYSSRYSVRYANSVDGGLTWGNFSVIDLGVYYYSYPIYFYNYEENPTIAIDNNDVVHVAWRHYKYSYDYSTSTYYYNYGIRYANNSGGSWNTPYDVELWNGSSGYKYHYAPSIATDSLNNVHIAWYGYPATSSVYNILYRKLDAKTGWQSMTLITLETSSTYAAYRPCIGTDPLDNVHVVWYQRTTTSSYYEIRSRMFNATSSAWANIENVTSGSSYYQYYPTVGADLSGNIYVAWQGNSPYMIYMSKKKLGGSYSSPDLISDGSEFTSSQYYPSLLGQGPNQFPLIGNVLVWAGYTGTYDTYFHSTDDFWLGETLEPTESKVKFTFTTTNVEPEIVVDSTSVLAVITEPVDIKFSIYDYGSDDLYYAFDFCDGNGVTTKGPFYNDGTNPDPYPSAMDGSAPIELSQTITHSFNTAGKQYLNISIWDDDMVPLDKKTNITLEIDVMGAKQMKEEAIRILEPLVPGRLDVIGYRNLTLEYQGTWKDKKYGNNDAPQSGSRCHTSNPTGPVTVLAYNYIDNGILGWEMKLIQTFCNVNMGTEIFIDGSVLDAGMLGNKVILKAYDKNLNLVSDVEIPTTWSCLSELETGQVFGDSNGEWEITGLGPVEGEVFFHYSKLAREVEDALDNILFSINKDPRRGYGWWHTHWIYYCGYWLNRELWVDDTRIDPEYGDLVFCEERSAVLHLMTVVNNCIKPDGVLNLTFRWTGKQDVDIEVYRYNTWWIFWGQWQHMQSETDISTNDTFLIDPDGPTNFGKLKPRLLIKVYKCSTGELLDAVYIRTSGYWPLEVEPGNMYGLLEIVDSNLKTNNGNVWRSWAGDWSWWDYFEWMASRSRCHSNNDKDKKDNKCYDSEIASEEEIRVCSNLTKIKMAIDLLVKADQLLAKVAYQDALDFTVMNSSNAEEYNYHLKMAKRYLLRGDREAGEGKPHRAITDYKTSWKNSILAIKWALKEYEGCVVQEITEDWESGKFYGGSGWLDSYWSYDCKDPKTEILHRKSGDKWSGDPYEGNYYLELGYGGKNHEYYTSWVSRAFSLENAKAAELTLQWQALDFEANEKAYIMLSKDGGLNWTIILTVQDGDDDKPYEKLVYNLSSFIGENKVILAIKTEMDTLSDRFCVDDIKIITTNCDVFDDPGDDQRWPDLDPDCTSGCQKPNCKKYGWFKGPWWLWWYMRFGRRNHWKNNYGYNHGQYKNCWNCWD